MHESTPETAEPAEPGVQDTQAVLHRATPPRRRRWWIPTLALIAVAALTAAGVARGSRTNADDAPRQLQVAAPALEQDAGPSTSDMGLGLEDAELIDLVRRVLDPSSSAEDRAALVESTPPGQPDPESIFASFDGLSDFVDADMADAEITVERPLEDVAIATVRVPLGATYGYDARLTDVVLRLGEDGWRVTYETICGLSSIAPIGGGTAVCHQQSELHHREGGPDLRTVLVEPGDTTQEAPTLATAPTVLAYGWTGTARTDDWVWLVDYPEAEFGGGSGPPTPAELVRVDATSGEETGRLRLTGTQPEMAAGDDELWVLQQFQLPDGGWQNPVLTRVDPNELTIQGEQPAPLGASSLRAAGDELWLAALDGVHRYTGSAFPLDESVLPLDALPAALSPTGDMSFAALPTGLLVLSSTGAPGGRLVGHDLTTRELDLPSGRLAASADTAWSLDADSGLLRRLDTDGRVVDTRQVPLSGASTIWADGDGGLWMTGRGHATADDGCCPGIEYSVAGRPAAVHLDDRGRVTDTWWLTGASTLATGWFDRVGDGLGWISDEGVQLVAP